MPPIQRKASLALDDQELLDLSASQNFSKCTVIDDLGKI